MKWSNEKTTWKKHFAILPICVQGDWLWLENYWTKDMTIYQAVSFEEPEELLDTKDLRGNKMTKDWKEELNRADIYWKEGEGDLCTAINVTKLEQFIESNFVSKAEIIKMIEGKMINKQVLTMDEAGYNMALDDIIKEIKSTK